MLTKEALAFLSSQAVASSAVKVDVVGSDIILVPEGYKTQDLEAFKLQRDRFRGVFKTSSIGDFCRYVEAHSSTAVKLKPAGFINPDVMTSTVIFNIGDQDNAGHCDDQAVLQLKKTAGFEAVCGVIGKRLSQQELAEFIEDWTVNVISYSGTGTMINSMAINAIRKMTISQLSQRTSVVGDLKSSTSSMDDIEAKSLEIMPTEFVFNVEPYEGLAEAFITLRLSVLTGGEAPILKLRWVRQEEQLEDIAKGFKDVVQKEIGGLVPMSIGHFAIG